VVVVFFFNENKIKALKTHIKCECGVFLIKVK
jgi:hypothetical protein